VPRREPTLGWRGERCAVQPSGRVSVCHARASSDSGWASSEALPLLLGFVLVTVPVALGATDAADRGLSDAVRGLPLPWLDALAAPVSWLGSGVVTAAQVLIMVVLIAPQRLRQSLTLFGAFAAIVAAEVVLKRWLSHPGPPAALDLDQLIAPGGRIPAGMPRGSCSSPLCLRTSCRSAGYRCYCRAGCFSP